MNIKNREQKRILCRINKLMKRALMPYLFEYNTPVVREKVGKQIEQTMKNILNVDKVEFVLNKEKSNKDIIVGDLYFTTPLIKLDFTITDKGVINENKNDR